jgi:hypothetical protein
MPSIDSRREVLCLCGTALGLGTAGCLGESSSGIGGDDSPNGTGSDDSPNGNGSAETTTSTDATTRTQSATASTDTTVRTKSTTSERTTIPASELSDSEARERALAAEEQFLTERLRNAPCLTDWGTSPTTASKRARVTERTAEGVSVDVTHPYWYSTERTEADVASNAVYLVTADSVRRVRGERVSVPC